MRSPKLFMDETRAPVLDPGRKRTKTGYLWTIARDQPWGGTDPPTVAYLYAPGRGAAHAIGPLAAGSVASSRWTRTTPTRRWPIPPATAVR